MPTFNPIRSPKYRNPYTHRPLPSPPAPTFSSLLFPPSPSKRTTMADQAHIPLVLSSLFTMSPWYSKPWKCFHSVASSTSRWLKSRLKYVLFARRLKSQQKYVLLTSLVEITTKSSARFWTKRDLSFGKRKGQERYR
ncbi:uncharacterized protein LOC132603309 [Lycium barbarum]|uniref:uncharacterized protein LOC132603309 n=1 Tax=Lycium barbarum TaxID=112863 RepID=UPI00293F011A|nr:uncharacterized protein LOC132603309 [Lycium barbarum]